MVSSRLPPGHRPYRQALLAGQPQLLSSPPPITTLAAAAAATHCPSVGSCSLLACRSDHAPVTEALLACQARPYPPLPPPYASGPSSRDFRPPLHACLGHLPKTVRQYTAEFATTPSPPPYPVYVCFVSSNVPVLWLDNCFRDFREEKTINFSRHSPGRPWLGRPGSR